MAFPWSGTKPSRSSAAWSSGCSRNRASAIAVPELDQIEISAAGHVNVTGGTNVDEPVRRLGQLLQAMLGYSESPVQLRLVVVQATAPAPAFGSIREYDEAVGYFERPGRDAVLQALYARAAAAPVRSDANHVATLDSIAPLPTTDRPKKSRKDAVKKSNPRRRQLMAGALLLLACAGGLGYARIAGIAPQNRKVSAIAQKASDAVGAAMVSGLSAVTERAGLGRLVSTDAADVNPSPAPVSPSVKRSRVKPAAAVLNPTVAPFEAFDLDQFPSVAAATSAADDPTVMPEDVEPAVAADEELRIYSAESEAVSPPIGVRPQLPRELPSNVSVEQLSRIDLIVSPAGTVESVKLVGTPHNVHHSMLLSAAKTWQFQPALKDGVPVRYRKTVWIALQ